MKNTYICTFVQSFSVHFASLNFLKKKIKAYEVESNRALVSGAGERRFAKPMLWPPLRTPSRAPGAPQIQRLWLTLHSGNSRSPGILYLSWPT